MADCCRYLHAPGLHPAWPVGRRAKKWVWRLVLPLPWFKIRHFGARQTWACATEPRRAPLRIQEPRCRPNWLKQRVDSTDIDFWKSNAGTQHLMLTLARRFEHWVDSGQCGLTRVPNRSILKINPATPDMKKHDKIAKTRRPASGLRYPAAVFFLAAIAAILSTVYSRLAEIIDLLDTKRVAASHR